MRLTDYHSAAVALAVTPAVKAAAEDGATIDLLGATGATFAISTGAIVSSGDFGVKVQESDNGSTWADAAAGDVKGNAPATLAASSAYKIGYAGHKRYVRLSITKAGGTSIALGAVAVVVKADKPVA